METFIQTSAVCFWLIVIIALFDVMPNNMIGQFILGIGIIFSLVFICVYGIKKLRK